MVRKTIALILVTFLVGVALGYSVLTGEQLTEISTLRTQVSSLQAQLAAAQAQETNLTNRVTELLLERSSLQSQVDNLTAERELLEEQLAELIRGEPSILAVRFSPKGGAASQVTYWIGRANKSVHVLIYSFTLDSVGDALLGAYQRGIDVKVVFEKSQVSRYSEYFRLEAAGAQVRNDSNPSLMHHKVAIIDGYIVLIGSFNWSSSADERNNENLLVIKSTELASTLELEFQRIWTTGR